MLYPLSEQRVNHLFSCAYLYVAPLTCVPAPRKKEALRRLRGKYNHQRQRDGRQTNKSRLRSRHHEAAPLCSHYLDRSVSYYRTGRRTGIQSGVSLKGNIHYSSQERRECTDCTEGVQFLRGWGGNGANLNALNTRCK